ncbi:hypothetical protein BDP27DRAFT_942087 [Rhodocollybia butyracea]|uniref:Uncharacterized protein n=1 Tax=Rhodocollybia butyracea TaxID=206335 RepID=A0A9P5U4S8_9AGAR|nr:hypothetical protein BDP27DRAFT_942087 [Rhodocollybia butyracea]
MQDDSAPGNALDMYDAERSSQPSDPVSENPRRKRPPLPPQSARFREARSTKASVPAPSTQEQGQLQAPKPPPPRSSAARDPPPHQQVAKFASLEIDDSAAPAHSTRRNQSPVYTDRREYENSSSTSVSADTSTGARAGSGMYADREALGVEDDTTIQLPRAPRAMGNKDDVDLGVSRAGPGRERSDRSRDFGPLHHPDRAWNEDLFIGRVVTYTSWWRQK